LVRVLPASVIPVPSVNEDCLSGRCGDGWISGQCCCSKQNLGSPCDDDSDCISNNCALLTCGSPQEGDPPVDEEEDTHKIPVTNAPATGNSPATSPGSITGESITFFTLRGEAGKHRGCIARAENNVGDVDALFLQACSSKDDTIQWRLDEKQSFRSKVNDGECIQATENPGSDGSLVAGTRLCVGSCEGKSANADLFQGMVVRMTCCWAEPALRAAPCGWPAGWFCV